METQQQKNKRSKKQGGVALLFVVLLTSVLLIVAIGISNISYRELEFSVEARDSDRAFFAADTGIECALYLDKEAIFTSSTTADCGGFSYSAPSGGSASVTNAPGSSVYNFIIPTPNQCVAVSVNKNYPYGTPTESYTLIQSIGYNVSADPGAVSSCLLTTTPNQNIVTRGLSTFYLNSAGSGSSGGSGGTTPPPPPSESVTTDSATSLSGTVEQLAGTATFDVASGPVNVGFNYDTDADYTASGGVYGSSIAASPLASSSSFMQRAIALTPCTKYDYQAYMSDASGAMYHGANGEFITSGAGCPSAIPPKVVLASATLDSTGTIGNLVGKLASIGSPGTPPATNVEFLVADPSGASTVTDSTTGTMVTGDAIGASSLASPGAFTGEDKGLACGTVYQFYAVASNVNGTAISAERDITTSPCSAVSEYVMTGASAPVSSSSEQLGGYAVFPATGTPNLVTFLYGTSASALSTSGPVYSLTSSSPGTSSFNIVIRGLLPCTTYYYEAQMTDSTTSLVYDGATDTFTTPCGTVPTVMTDSVYQFPGTSGAVNLSGSVTDSGTTSTGAVDAVTSGGFVYGTNPAGPFTFSTPTSTPIAGSAPPVISMSAELYTGIFGVASFMPCTTYFFEATATNSTGTATGSPVKFTTNC